MSGTNSPSPINAFVVVTGLTAGVAIRGATGANAPAIAAIATTQIEARIVAITEKVVRRFIKIN